MDNNKPKDLVILGGGPAGITAAIYATRGLLDCVILEAATIGGQLNLTEHIENYPGYAKISGYELIEKFQEQLNNLNVNIKQFQEIEHINFTDKIKTITTKEGSYKTKTILIATGANPRKLEIKGEREYTGRGVSYCAVCDGAFFKEKVITVIGGGNSAVEEAIYLTRFGSKVYIVHRRDKLRANKAYQEKAFNNPKIEFVWNAVPVEIEGNEKGVTNLVIKNVQNNEIKNLSTDGVFPFVGTIPNTLLAEGQIELDENGYIPTDENMRTNVDGVYAAGDVRKTTLRQLVVSASDGAIAATDAIKYIEEVFEKDSIKA
ncbi:MAG: thioredoxin-disulfide reductase [Vampirovibrionia bacterium]